MLAGATPMKTETLPIAIFLKLSSVDITNASVMAIITIMFALAVLFFFTKLYAKIENLSYNIAGFSLKVPSFAVEKGEYFVLVGPSAAGKTTLVECLTGIRKISTGSIILNGNEISCAEPEKRNIGYLPQNCLLFPHMTVKENIFFGLKAKGYFKSEIIKRANKAVRMLNMDAIMERSIKTLSGGEHQRVALARALVINPLLVILDEPFRRYMWDYD